ncbi:MAG: hypothetical protein IPP88_09375 [Betaproteobacteria bacterium]|nr:hypothetical protein [Betaproteobacteria bacterium]
MNWKCRCTRATKKRLQHDATTAGKELSDYLRDLVDAPQQAATVVDVLSRLEQLMAAVGPLLKPRDTDQASDRLARLEVIVEELAMQTSPHVMSRVNLRLKQQTN